MTRQEEEELKRENFYRSPNYHPETERITYEDDDESDNYSPARKPLNNNQESNEPVSLNLKPKAKFANYQPVTFFAWQLFQVRIEVNFNYPMCLILFLNL